MQRKVFTFELRALVSVIVCLNLLFCSSNPLVANPTGGVVAGGSATISGGAGLTTIRQSSNAAVINWQGFSINSNETTRFIQPSSQSATLNRVLGGSTSQINGALQANGQVYLINQNGIVVGPSGVINAAGGFVGSTRDISDSDFKHNHQHFMGHGSGSVINQGVIQSSLGKVVLIGKTVNNSGTIQAHGTAGLVAGDDVLLGQQNADGSSITVNTSPLATSATGLVGVSNSGSIVATAAELKAANGNIYSLAIQNQGSIRASTVSHQGGHIWLTADTGTIVNTGTLDASSTVAKGNGGSVTMKNMGGLTVDSGKILAKGGTGGTGGNAEVSGSVLQFTGTVDLTAQDGKTGNLLFDPENVTIQAAGSTTVTLHSGTYTATNANSIITVASLESNLATANITVSTGSDGSQQGDITVANALTWSSASTLTLSAANNIYLNANITATKGGLTLSGTNIASGNETTSGSITANIKVKNFILEKGFWGQNANGGTLPTFIASNDFEVNGSSSSFFRVANGAGSTGNPFQITDIYGLQGIGSPSKSFLDDDYVLNNNISATGTATWNSGRGFNPIGQVGYSYEGILNGGGYTINGLTINQSDGYATGLIESLGGTVTGLGLTNETVTGTYEVGGLAGETYGTITNCYVSGNITGIAYSGGLIGDGGGGTISQSYSTGNVTAISGGNGFGGFGGLAGIMGGTALYECYSTSTVTITPGAGQSPDIGGLVGANGGNGVITNCYATGAVNAIECSDVGGLAGENQNIVKGSYATGNVTGASIVGGLVGVNEYNGYSSVNLESCYSTGSVTCASGGQYIGGLVGSNGEPIANCYTTSKVIAGIGCSDIGGLIGYNTSSIATSYWATDAGGQNGSLPTIGDNGTGGTVDGYTAGVTLAQLGQQATYQPAGTAAGQWDFTLGTGVWGINGVSNSGQINSGLPYLQWQYPTLAQITVGDQTTTYNKTTTGDGFSTSGYTVNNYAAGTTSLSGVLTNGTASVVGTNVNVGTSDAISLTGVFTGNDAVEVVNGTETFSSRAITVSANAGSSQYGLAPTNPGIAVTSGTLAGNDTLSGLGIGDNFTTLGLTSSSNVGTYDNSVTGAAIQQNYLVTTVVGAYNITQAPLTVVAGSGTSQYGLTPVNPGISIGAGTKLYNGSTLTSLGLGDNFATLVSSASSAGTYTTEVTSPTLMNYLLTGVIGTYTVTKAPITVTVTNGTSQYGLTPTDPGIKLTSGKLYNNDSLSTAGLGDSFNLTATSNAGSTALTVTGTPDNYKVTGVNGTYAITKAPIDVAVNTGGTNQYGLTPTDPGIVLSGGTLYNGDTLSSLDLSDSFNLTNASNAASYTITVVSGLPIANYTYTPKSATYIITKAPLDVAVNTGESSQYGTKPIDPGVSVTDGTILYNGNTLSSLKVGDSFALTSASNAQNYTLNVTGYTTLTNYAVTPTQGTYTITQAPLEVKAKDGTSQYGLTPVNPGISIESGTLYNGATLASLGFSDDFATLKLTGATAVGSYYDAVTGPTNPTNYSVTTDLGTYTITQAPLTVVAKNGTSQYGLTPVDPGIAVGPGTTLYNGQTLAGLGFADSFASLLLTSASAAGTYNEVVTEQSVPMNYNVTEGLGIYTISKAPITVTVISGTSQYGLTPTDPGIKITSGKLYNGDTLSALITAGLGDSFNLTAANNAGSTALTVTGTPDNYKVTGVNGTYTITKAKIDVAVNTGGTSQYGITPTNPGIELTGGTLYNTDTINSIGLGDNFSLTDASNAGSSTIAVTGTSADYTYTPTSAPYYITKAPLVIAVISGGTSQYGTTPVNPGIAVTSGTTLYNGSTLSSLKVGDNFALTSASNVGTYEIILTGYLTLSNYQVDTIGSPFTITRAPLTVVANNGTSQYGDTHVNPGISVGTGTKLYNAATLAGLGFNDNFATLDLTSLSNAGTYSDSVTGPTTLTNYAITEEGGSYTITQAPLKVVANSGTSQYGLTPVDPGISVGAGTKLYGGLTLSGLGFSDNFATLVSSTIDAGTYTTAVLGPTSLTNYVITDVTGTYTITKAPITVTVSSGSSPFGSTPIDPGIKLTLGKLYNNDTLNTIGLGDSFNLTDASTIGSYILTVTGSPDNYTVKSVNGTYKITN